MTFDAVIEQLRTDDARTAERPLLVELVLSEFAQDPATTVSAIHCPGESTPRWPRDP